MKCEHCMGYEGEYCQTCYEIYGRAQAAQAQASLLRELAEAMTPCIRTMEDMGSFASWIIVPIGTAEQLGAAEALAALKSLLEVKP